MRLKAVNAEFQCFDDGSKIISVETLESSQISQQLLVSVFTSVCVCLLRNVGKKKPQPCSFLTVGFTKLCVNHTAVSLKTKINEKNIEQSVH